jgi:hypothetical protein
MRLTSVHRRRAALHGCVAALFGAVSLLGQGLHLLPGLSHTPGCDTCLSTLHCDGEHGAEDCCDHAGHGTTIAPAQTHASGQHGTCPICDFYASGKLLAATATAIWSSHVVSCELPPAPACTPQRQASPLGPRGPPSV